MKLFDYIKKYGVSSVMLFTTLDGYRRNVQADSKESHLMSENKKLREELASKLQALEESDRVHIRSQINQVQLVEKEDAYKSALNRLQKDPNNEAYKASYAKSLKEKDEALENIKDSINKFSLGDVITKVIDGYSNFLSTLSSDQIAIIFNLIIGSLAINSYLTVFSVLLSENILNRIKFLENYPRILRFLRFRNSVNKKMNKVIFITHFLILLIGILGNLYMFFIKIYFFVYIDINLTLLIM